MLNVKIPGGVVSARQVPFWLWHGTMENHMDHDGTLEIHMYHDGTMEIHMHYDGTMCAFKKTCIRNRQ